VILLASLRSALGAVFFTVFTFFWSAVGILEFLTVNNRDLESWFMSFWGRLGLRVFGVKLEIKGTENIPQGSCLFLFNHSSFFDIFALVAAYPDMRFGAKSELFKVPLFGTAMRRFGVLPIARAKKEEVFKVYEEATVRVKRGEKFSLAPEGGRNFDGQLLPFKAGPFIFAIKAGMPIVPSVVLGAHEVMGKGALLPNWDQWSRTITVVYLPQIPTSNVPLDQRGKLQETAFLAMQKTISSATIEI
jgi:1-acyl-sn-glycerol-3-phosphate acyltransferase